MAGVSASTYNLIGTVSAAGSSSAFFITIPQNYTDLVLVYNGSVTTNNTGPIITVNSDSGTNYSYTRLSGNGSSPGSDRTTNNAGAGWAISTVADQTIVQVHFMNYSNPNIWKTFIERWNDASSYVGAIAFLYRSFTPITRINISAGTSTFASGSTFSLYGIKAADVTSVTPTKAIGGDSITSDGTYTYHTFNSAGSFIPARALTCDVLVVGGGGGGGGGRNGVSYNGGGAGAIVNQQTGMSFFANVSYSVLVGAGGTMSVINATNAGNGSTSSIIGGFVNQSAAGGGGAQSTSNGANGGSNSLYTGGLSLFSNGSYYGAGGGAGAGGNGGSSNQLNTGGNGGAGVTPTMLGYAIAGGGAGGGYLSSGSVSAGGGTGNPTDSSVSSYGAGGGGTTSTSLGVGGAGVVIVRYLS
jgi:hypothetical protein